MGVCYACSMLSASAAIAASAIHLKGLPSRGGIGGLMMAALLMLVSAVTAQGDASSRQAIAVLPHTIVGTSDQVGAADWGVNLAIEIEAELTRSRRFLVVDRRQIETILDEAWLRLGSLTTAQFQEYGELLGADLFIDGAISTHPTGQLRINTRVVNARTGQVIEVRGANAPGPEAFATVAQEYSAWAAERFPLEGRIAAIDGQRAYIDLGTDAGITAGDEGELLRDRLIADLTITEAIGTFRVTRPSAAASLIEATLEPGIQLRPGDRALFQPPAPDPPPTPAVTTGTLLVRGAPLGAVVLVDGVEVGVVGAAGWARQLPVGSVRVEVRAEGFEPFTGPVEVLAERVTEVTVQLLALPPVVGSLSLLVQPADASVFVNGALVGRGNVELDDLVPGVVRYRVEAAGFEPVSGEVRVVAGAAEVVRVTLSALLGTVLIDVNVPVYEVFVDGGYFGSMREVTLAPGQYEVTVTADDYEPITRSVQVSPGSAVRVEATLRPSPPSGGRERTGDLTIAWEAYALTAGGRRYLEGGVVAYDAGSDVFVTHRTSSQTGEAYQRRWVRLSDTFNLGVTVVPHEGLTGIGLWISMPEHPDGFSWEWFDRLEGATFRKRQGSGDVLLRVFHGVGFQELAAVEFLDDIVMRFQADTTLGPGNESHEVVILGGSVFQVAR
jgi:TolB-like protein